MPLSSPRVFFGVHSISPYSRTTGEYYGELRVLENSTLSVTAEMIDLMGGSNNFNWATEVGSMTAEMSLSFSEFPDFVFELFGGKAPTTNAAEAAGSITTLTNVLGTTAKSATIGIASVGLTALKSADLKFGKYVIKAAAAATVDVFFSSDLDIGRGENGTMQDDTLKITATALTVVTGAAVVVPNFGIEFTGGSGTIGMTVGDTAEFYVRPTNTKSMDVILGSTANQNFPEFGAIIMGNKLSTGEMIEAEAYKCKGAGLPINFARNAFSSAEITVKMLYDSAKDGVIAIRHVNPTTP